MSKGTEARLAIGVLPAVFLKLLAGERSFSVEETTVLAAMKRFNSDLANASVDEIAERVRSMAPEQLAGFHTNVKAVYHELRTVEREGADDDLEAEVYDLMRHPGADFRLVNGTTGETVDIQLTTIESMRYLREYQERYANVEVHATGDVAVSSGAASSGFSNSGLARNVNATLEKLGNDGCGERECATASGLLSGVANARAALQGGRTGHAAMRDALERIGIGVANTALLELLLG